MSQSSQFWNSIVFSLQKLLARKKTCRMAWVLFGMDDKILRSPADFKFAVILMFSLQCYNFVSSVFSFQTLISFESGCIFIYFFDRDSLHVRLNSHYKVWSVKRRKEKKWWKACIGRFFRKNAKKQFRQFRS